MDQDPSRPRATERERPRWAARVVGRLRELTVRLRRVHAQGRGALANVREAQAALAEREALLALAHEVGGTGYWVLDVATDAVTWSPELCRILGEDPGTARPSVEALWRQVHPGDHARLREYADLLLRGDSVTASEFRLVRPDGSLRWVHGRGRALCGPGGELVKLLGTVHDVTEQKELHAQVAAAERLATVGTLATGMAHEINNPLALVVSNLEFVQAELQGLSAALPGRRVEQLAAAADEALQGADRVRRIVRDLRDFARPDHEPGPVDVERVLDLSVKMAAGELRPRARVVREYGRVPFAHADPSRLGQVFVNLLVNAAHAIPAGRPEANEIRISTRLDQHRISIAVRDTGAGMTPEIRRRVFEPFFTTKPVGAGTGLGLTTSLGSIRALGGDIGVESEPGKGSVFTVVLPVAGGARPGGAR